MAVGWCNSMTRPTLKQAKEIIERVRTFKPDIHIYYAPDGTCRLPDNPKALCGKPVDYGINSTKCITDSNCVACIDENTRQILIGGKV